MDSPWLTKWKKKLSKRRSQRPLSNAVYSQVASNVSTRGKNFTLLWAVIWNVQFFKKRYTTPSNQRGGDNATPSGSSCFSVPDTACLPNVCPSCFSAQFLSISAPTGSSSTLTWERFRNQKSPPSNQGGTRPRGNRVFSLFVPNHSSPPFPPWTLGLF